MKYALAALVLAALPVAASASSVAPVGYTYVNAPNGTAYFDDTYNGQTGELIDGIVATQSWVGTDGNGAIGPNVGWNSINPVITFSFAEVTDFVGLTVNMQDTKGGAGVGLAASMTVNGITSPALVGAPTPQGQNGIDDTPVNATMDLSALAPTDELTLTINRGFQWTFISEVSFAAVSPTAVPVPAGLPLLLAGLGGFAVLRRQRAAQA